MKTNFDDVCKVKAIQLREEGDTYNVISSRLGIPSSTVRNFLNRRSHLPWWERYVNGKFEHICKNIGFTSAAIPSKFKLPKKTNTLDDDDAKEAAILLSEAPHMNITRVAKELNLERDCVGRFLSKKTYKTWWEDREMCASGDKFTDCGVEFPENVDLDGTTDAESSAEEDEPIFRGEMEEMQYDTNYLGASNVFVISSAQNNTHVNNEFMDALESYCQHNSAELLISPFYYNTSGVLGNKTEKGVYDSRVVPYLVDEPITLSDYLGGLIFCAEMDILPTAVNPFSSMHTYTKKASAIYPHTKMQLESVPTPKHDVCRMMYSTGAVTMRNYVARKAGQKASFHHVFGALVVEVDHVNKCWFVRQLNSDADGSIQDLDKLYLPDGSVQDADIEAVNWGDIHAEKCEQAQIDLCFGSGGILDALKPNYQFANDLSDFTPRNHHNRKDPHFLYKTSNSTIRTVEDGLNQASDMLKLMSRDWCETVVVNSNHDNALVKWLKEADYRTDPDNAKFFLVAQLECYMAIDRQDNNFSIFEKSLTDLVSSPVDMQKHKVKFLREDESFKICTHKAEDAIECGYHGHTGLNGARGSITSYMKLGTRVNIGHSHSANIRDGVYQAGVTGNLDMGYNIGASSWSHSHIITYSNGKRCMVTTHNDAWKLPEEYKVSQSKDSA